MSKLMLLGIVSWWIFHVLNDMLLKLREKYVVYLLSNTNEIHWKWACEHAFPYRGFRVEDYFEKMYLSYEMKMVKPAEEIFRECLMMQTSIRAKLFHR